MDELLPYYNRELEYLRKSGALFAKAHPKIAGRLRLGPDVAEDPHVARMIEAFAYLNARTRHKIEDDFPEITEAMLGVLYPHYLRPIPSMAIVQFSLDRSQGELTSGYQIDRGKVIETELIDGEPCRFRTCYDVDLRPFELKSVALSGQPYRAPDSPYSSKATAVLRLQLECLAAEVSFQQLSLDRFRLFITGSAPVNYELHEMLLNDVVGVAVAQSPDDRDACFLPNDVDSRLRGSGCIKPVGFGLDEGILEHQPRSFVGYRLLAEYFAYPEKFLFVDLCIPAAAMRNIGRHLEIFCYVERDVTELERFVDGNTFQFGCTPMVNLFQQRAEPIQLSHAQSEYRVVPDARRPLAYEIYSIDRVVGSGEQGEEQEYHPFYSSKHGGDDEGGRAYWHATRREADEEDRMFDEGTDVHLSFVDLDFDPMVAGEQTVDVETTCLSRDLPRRLPFGGGQPILHLIGGGPLESIRCLTPPSPTLRPSLRHGTRWRLVSHLCLNHLSLVDFEDGADALREILRLYDFKNSADSRDAIDGILSIGVERVVRRLKDAPPPGLCRGLKLELRLDGKKFSGGGAYLFASVLDRFFRLYSSINSFTLTTAVITEREGETWEWPAREGQRILL